ncbi:MAG: histidine phosphatase family protein [Thermoleophilia bacterium]
MKQLWLLRHAKSSWDYPGLADHDRPLAPRGRKAAKRIARWADAHEVRPELVLASTALRAQATLDLVGHGLGDFEVRSESGLYDTSTDALLERLRTVDKSVTRILIVGHNPTLYELATILAPPGPDAFPTGALAGLRLTIGTWKEIRSGCGQLEEFVVPRSLAG